MIEYAAFALPIFLLAMVALLLWSIVGTRGRWWLKLLFISTIPLSTVAVWSSLHSYQGWPTNEELPARFLVYWAIVDEPNKRSGDPGAIYLWVRAKKYPVVPLRRFFGYRYDPEAPRSYGLSYSRELHEQIALIQGALRAGRLIAGENQGFGKGKGKRNSYGAPKSDINLYILPPVQLPSKDPAQQ